MARKVVRSADSNVARMLEPISRCLAGGKVDSLCVMWDFWFPYWKTSIPSFFSPRVGTRDVLDAIVEKSAKQERSGSRKILIWLRFSLIGRPMSGKDVTWSMHGRGACCADLLPVLRDMANTVFLTVKSAGVYHDHYIGMRKSGSKVYENTERSTLSCRLCRRLTGRIFVLVIFNAEKGVVVRQKNRWLRHVSRKGIIIVVVNWDKDDHTAKELGEYLGQFQYISYVIIFVSCPDQATSP